MKKVRKIILALLLIVFALNVFGFIFLFTAAKEIVKEETWKEISEFKSSEKVEVLSVSVSDYKTGQVVQRINEKEIRYKGKMFDIVKVERLGSKLVFYCIHDEAEDKLDKEFSNVIHNNLDPKSTNYLTNLVQLVQYAETGKKINVHSPIRQNNFSSFYIIQFSQTDPQILTPPPKLVSM